jgi:hypothetical protein
MQSSRKTKAENETVLQEYASAWDLSHKTKHKLATGLQDQAWAWDHHRRLRMTMRLSLKTKKEN